MKQENKTTNNITNFSFFGRRGKQLSDVKIDNIVQDSHYDQIKELDFEKLKDLSRWFTVNLGYSVANISGKWDSYLVGLVDKQNPSNFLGKNYAGYRVNFDGSLSVRYTKIQMKEKSFLTKFINEIGVNLKNNIGMKIKATNNSLGFKLEFKKKVKNEKDWELSELMKTFSDFYLFENFGHFSVDEVFYNKKNKNYLLVSFDIKIIDDVENFLTGFFGAEYKYDYAFSEYEKMKKIARDRKIKEEEDKANAILLKMKENTEIMQTFYKEFYLNLPIIENHIIRKTGNVVFHFKKTENNLLLYQIFLVKPYGKRFKAASLDIPLAYLQKYVFSMNFKNNEELSSIILDENYTTFSPFKTKTQAALEMSSDDINISSRYRVLF